jgi:hypothetical protein
MVNQGMLYVEIEQHINDDGTEIDMNEDKMSMLIPGHLQNREADFKEDAPEAMVRILRMVTLDPEPRPPPCSTPHKHLASTIGKWRAESMEA